MNQEITKDNVLDYIIAWGKVLDNLNCDRGFTVSQEWYDHAVNGGLCPAVKILEKIRADDAKEALFRFKLNSSYWPAHCEINAG